MQVKKTVIMIVVVVAFFWMCRGAWNVVEKSRVKSAQANAKKWEKKYSDILDNNEIQIQENIDLQRRVDAYIKKYESGTAKVVEKK
jgi:hypothetical protein